MLGAVAFFGADPCCIYWGDTLCVLLPGRRGRPAKAGLHLLGAVALFGRRPVLNFIEGRRFAAR
jgi:hypothetical protein